MSTKPILFSDEMIRAILADRKTITRRPVKPQPFGGEATYHNKNIYGQHIFYPVSDEENAYDREDGLYHPPFQTGDVLWVRETWTPSLQCGAAYRADNITEVPRWRPSIHMPKRACRLFLRVTDVRVQRVQEISEEDAITEGIQSFRQGYQGEHGTFNGAPIFGVDVGSAESSSAKDAMEALWDSIYGNWDANPWVWVISFNRADKPEGWPVKG